MKRLLASIILLTISLPIFADNQNSVFKKAINKRLSQPSLCMDFRSIFIDDKYQHYTKDNFGVIVEKEQSKIVDGKIEKEILPQLGDSTYKFDQYKQLLKEGLVSEKIVSNKVSDTETDIIHLYNLTDKADKYLYKNFTTTKKSSHDNELCYARLKVANIIEYIDIEAYKVKATKVKFNQETYDIADWYKDGGKVFHRWSIPTDNSRVSGEKNITLIKTSNGWRPIERSDYY